MLLYLLLFFAALVFFLMAAFGFSTRRINLLALGLACCALVWVLQTAQHV